MAPTRCAPDPMPIFGTSGSRTSPPEVGKLAGRLAITNTEWTAWMQFSSAKNPGEVALGYGYRGKSDDLPDEMVDVLCIIFGSKGRKFAVARQGDGTLFAAGFFNQQGELAWKALQAPASAAAQMPPAVLSELNAYLQLTEYQVNNRRNKLRKRALVAREPGASLSARSYQKRLHGSGEQEEAPMEVMAFPEQEVPAPQPRSPLRVEQDEIYQSLLAVLAEQADSQSRRLEQQEAPVEDLQQLAEAAALDSLPPVQRQVEQPVQSEEVQEEVQQQQEEMENGGQLWDVLPILPGVDIIRGALSAAECAAIVRSMTAKRAQEDAEQFTIM